MSSDMAIRVQNLSKCYRIYDRPQDRLNEMIIPRLQKVAGLKPHHYGREFWALKDVSFEVKKGETFGIIGKNGSGKSTLLQLIAGILEPTSGNLNVNGRIAALLELGSGFNPEFSGKENVFLNAGILGLTQEETESRYQKIIGFADIGDFIDQPVKTYSSGMMMRLAFAVQASVDASIVIIDEALSVGDIFFRQKCYARLEELKNMGAAILLVSHSMPEVEQFCKRAILLDDGKAQYIGAASEVAKYYYLLGNSSNRSPPLDISISDLKEDGNSSENLAFPKPNKKCNLDINNKLQIGIGSARFTAVAVCNEHFEAKSIFCQNETVIFHIEIEVIKDFEIPICGLVIKNEQGIIVHGKNSWQMPDSFDGITNAQSGSRIVFQYELQLNLAPGAYTFELGLAGVSKDIWINRENISHEDFDINFQRICEMTNVGIFEIGLKDRPGGKILTHHGVADLPGSMKIFQNHNSVDCTN